MTKRDCKKQANGEEKKEEKNLLNKTWYFPSSLIWYLYSRPFLSFRPIPSHQVAVVFLLPISSVKLPANKSKKIKVNK